MKIVSVVGARPNFMKVAPFCRALKAYPDVKHVLVHTGQHYDVRMSEQFFKELDIPNPDINLEIGSGTHAEQVGRTMIAFEKSTSKIFGCKFLRKRNPTGLLSWATSMQRAPARLRRRRSI